MFARGRFVSDFGTNVEFLARSTPPYHCSIREGISSALQIEGKVFMRKIRLCRSSKTWESCDNRLLTSAFQVPTSQASNVCIPDYFVDVSCRHTDKSSICMVYLCAIGAFLAVTISRLCKHLGQRPRCTGTHSASSTQAGAVRPSGTQACSAGVRPHQTIFDASISHVSQSTSSSSNCPEQWHPASHFSLMSVLMDFVENIFMQ